MENKSSLLSQLPLRSKFILARWCYAIGDPIISDAEYTGLLRAMQIALPKDEYCHRSWSSDPCPVDLLKQIGRPDLIKSIILGDKTESIPSLNSDIELRRALFDFVGDGTVSMKHDGWNMQASYYNQYLVNVQTRGRKSDAIAANHVAKILPQKIPVMGSVMIPGEATVNIQNFPFCAKVWNNVSQRSAVSSVLAHPEYVQLLDFHGFDIHGYDYAGNKFEVLKSWGFNVPEYRTVRDFAEILWALQELSEMKENYLSPTDGAVFDSKTLRRAIRLLAWEEPIYKSFCTGIHEQWKAYRISPSVTIYPVMRNGTTQRQINMTNLQRIIDYDLRPGSPIAFRIASGATADFDEDATTNLRIEYAGRWEEYCEMIKEDEEVKRIQWKSLQH